MSSHKQPSESRLSGFLQRVASHVIFYLRPHIKKFEQRFPEVTEQLQNIKHTAIQKLKSGLKATAYWSGICVLGLIIAASIMQFSGVPIFAPVHAAGTISNFVLVLAMNFLYYVILAPLAVLGTIFAYIFQIVVTYPYGAVWTTLGTSSPENGFINVSGVITGWTLVRDVCNVLFALVLVIIALGTVLRFENYQWKNMLPTFIMAVIMVNFSRTICGIFTDFATVAMATFAGSFGESFATGIISGFGLPSMFDLVDANYSSSSADFEKSGSVSILLAYIAMAGILIWLLPLLLMFCGILILRIIMLWFLIAISPIAFFASVLPQTKSHAGKWWTQFGNMVAVGPIMTFFLWLALTMAYGTQTAEGEPSGATPLGVTVAKQVEEDAIGKSGANNVIKAPATGPFKAASPNVLANFLIMYIMLLAGLRITMSLAGEVGKMAGKLADVGEMAVNKSGQILGRAGIWGKNRYGQAGPDATRMGKLGAKTASFLGTSAAMLGSSALQPKEWWGRFKTNWSASSKEKQKAFIEDMTRQAEGLTNQKVLTADNAWDATGNFLKKTAGVAWSGGLQNGQDVFDKYVSWDNIKTTGKYFAARMGGKLNPADKNQYDTDLKNANDKFEDGKKRLTQEEYDKMIADHTAAASLYTNTRSLSDGIQNEDADLDLENLATQAMLKERALPVLLQALQKAEVEGKTGLVTDLKSRIEAVKYLANPEQREKELKAQQRRALELQNAQPNTAEAAELKEVTDKINLLKNLRSNQEVKTKINAKEFFEKYIGDPKLQGDAKNGMMQALKVSMSQLESGLGKSSERLNAVGALVLGKDQNYEVKRAGDPLKFVTDDERKDLENKWRVAKSQVDKRRMLESSFEPKASPRARFTKQERVNKAYAELREVKDSQELMEFVANGIQEGKGDIVEAAMRRIAENGDMDLVLRDFMMLNDDGTVDDKARTDAEGLHNFIQKKLIGQMHMTDQEAYSRMNDVVSIASKNGYQNLSNSIAFQGNRWEAVPEDKRNQIMAQRMKAANIVDVVKWGANDWGYTDANGRYQLNKDAATAALGRLGEDLASDRWWNSLNTNAKQIFAQNIDELREGGVSEALIERLQDYWETTGKFEDTTTGLIQRSYYGR